MSELTTDNVRHIVREEIAGSPDVTGMKSDISVLKIDVSGLKTDVSELRADVTRLSVMFEHFDAKMDAVAELVTTTVATRNDTIDLKERVGHLESDVAVLKLAIRK